MMMMVMMVMIVYPSLRHPNHVSADRFLRASHYYFRFPNRSFCVIAKPHLVVK